MKTMWKPHWPLNCRNISINRNTLTILIFKDEESWWRKKQCTSQNKLGWAICVRMASPKSHDNQLSKKGRVSRPHVWLYHIETMEIARLWKINQESSAGFSTDLADIAWSSGLSPKLTVHCLTSATCGKNKPILVEMLQFKYTRFWCLVVWPDKSGASLLTKRLCKLHMTRSLLELVRLQNAEIGTDHWDSSKCKHEKKRDERGFYHVDHSNVHIGSRSADN
jgi:hypothetical protein